MKALILAAVAAGALVTAGAASATVVADFQLNNSLANAVASGVTLTNNGATLGATGLTFDANNGPTLNGLGAISSYTLEMGVTLDQTDGYRKIADFFDRTSDSGFYDLGGNLNFYPVTTGALSVISAGTPFVVKLTRDSSSLVTGYVNGVSQFSFVDSTNLAVINDTLHLFRDDFATGEREAASGFLDYVTLDAGEPGATAGVPEPATWALMILGFGGVGAMVRRRAVAA